MTGLTNGTAYTLALRAVNGSGTGAVSSIAATPVAVPAPPSGLTAAAGDAQVTLSWTDPGNDTITGYELRVDSGAWADIAGSDADTASHTVTGLTNGTEYSFALRAANASGDGAVSSIAATPVAAVAGVPAAPVGLSATPGDAQVTLSWTDPGDDTIDNYQVSSDGGTSFADIAGSGADTTGHIVTGLTNGTAYTLALRAVNGSGTGAVSSIAATPVAVPAPPSGLTAAAGDAQVTLSWTDPGNDTITGYELRVDSGAWADIAGSDADTASHTVTGLTNGTEYSFALRAANASGDGAVSSIAATPRAAVAGVPAAPVGLSATPGDAQVTLSWTDPGDATIDNYQLSSDGGTSFADIAGSGARPYTGLTNGTAYTLALRAVNASGDGAVSSIAATPVAAVAGVPAAPVGLSATPGYAQVTLSWTDPGDDTIDNYQVSSDGGTSFADIPGSGATTTDHTVTGLTNGTEYTFALRAVNGSGSGAVTTVSATPENNPPRRVKSIAELIADGVLTVGTTLEVDISDTFDDQDADDTLSYTAVSNAPAALIVAMSETMLTLTGMTLGTATVTVTASDGTDSVDDKFTVTVVEAEADTLQLKVSFAQALYEIKEGQQTDIEVKMSPTADRRVKVPLVVSLKGGATDEDYSGVPAKVVFEEALEVMEAVIARSMGESVQTAIEGRFERYRQWSRLGPSVRAMLPPRPGSDNRAAALGSGESERTGSDGAGGRGAEGSVVQSASGAAKTSAATESGWNSENQGTGTPGSWLRSLSLGSLGNVVRSGQAHLGASPGSGMEPSGRVYGQDRLYGSGVEDPLLGPDSGDFSGMRDLGLSLSEVSFEMSPGESEQETSWVPVLWGHGDLQHFNGDLSRLGMNYRGGLEAGHLGVDLYANDRMLTGLSFMSSWGDLDYTDDGVDGVLESRMNTVHPYLYWQANERVSVWGIGGLGTGQVEVREPGRTHDFDADFRMLAGGVRSVLSRRGNNEWGLRADAFTTQLETDASEDIAKVSGEAHRGRLMLEWVHDRALSTGRALSVRAEAGGRFDGGDAERGAGVETGVRLGYLDANHGLDVALHGRVLVVHASDYRDWGVGVQASWDPEEKQRGFRASAMSSLGQDGGGRTTLWDNADAATRPAGTGAMGIGSQYRMESEVAYAGLKAPGLPGLLTPYGRLRWDGQGRELAMGTAWSPSAALPAMLELEAIRRETRTGPADLGVLLRVSIPLGGSREVIPGRGRVSAQAPDPKLIPRGFAESGADGPQATAAAIKPPAEPVSAAQQDANLPPEPATPEPASPASQSAQASVQPQRPAPPSTTAAPDRGKACVVNVQPTPQRRSVASPTQTAELQAQATPPRLELRRQSPPAVTSSDGPAPKVLPSGGMVVQVGAFRRAERAARITDELRQKGHAAITIGGSDYHRVVVGPFPSRNDAAGAQSQLEQKGYRGYLRADLVRAPLPVTDTRRIGT